MAWHVRHRGIYMNSTGSPFRPVSTVVYQSPSPDAVSSPINSTPLSTSANHFTPTRRRQRLRPLEAVAGYGSPSGPITHISATLDEHPYPPYDYLNEFWLPPRPNLGPSSHAQGHHAISDIQNAYGRTAHIQRNVMGEVPSALQSSPGQTRPSISPRTMFLSATDNPRRKAHAATTNTALRLPLSDTDQVVVPQGQPMDLRRSTSSRRLVATQLANDPHLLFRGGKAPLIIPVPPPHEGDMNEQTATWGARPRTDRRAAPPRSAVSSPLTPTSLNLSPLRSTVCSVCFDSSDDFPPVPHTVDCIHKPTVCSSCLEQYITVAVLTDGLTDILCPDAECRKPMAYSDVQRSVNNNQTCLERYEELLLRRALQDDPNFVWCKNPGCDAGQLHEGGDADPIVICHVCRTWSCFTHDMVWHAGLTCAQYNIQNDKQAQYLASEDYINHNAKTCPNKNCGRRIQKAEGCDHMTCRRPGGCGHEFCWLCLADYATIRSQGNHRHNTTCSHYRALEGRIGRRTW
ncbi:hypothetical protein FRC12_004173 [Ceratobasidium sp. 428]|nr:hypothetical protein FRC12_004173 [Ceratobasidium sp. 428]